MRRFALALMIAALAAPQVLAQGLPVGLPHGHRSGSSRLKPTEWTPKGAPGVVACYDLTDPASVVWGSVILDGTNDQVANTSSTPASENTYPVVVFGWFYKTISGSKIILHFTDNDASEVLGVGVTSAGNKLQCYTTASGSSAVAQTTGAVTLSTWYRYVAVWESNDSRSVFLSNDTTGGTNTANKAPSGIDRVIFGGDITQAADWPGRLGPHHVFVGGTVPTAAQRDAFLVDCVDPEVAMGVSATALWFSGATPKLDARGSVNLTSVTDSVADGTDLVAVRNSVDYLTYPMVATTAAPTFDPTAFGTGGANFSGSQFLICSSAPVTAAPFQVYAVASSTDTVNRQSVVSLGDSASGTASFSLEFEGDLASDPIGWTANDGVQRTASSSTGYSSGNNYLLWGLETSTTSRKAEIDGGSQGTNSVSCVPSGINRVGLGVLATSGLIWKQTGKIGFAAILNTASTTEKDNFERWAWRHFGVFSPSTFDPKYSDGVAAAWDGRASAFAADLGIKGGYNGDGSFNLNMTGASPIAASDLAGGVVLVMHANISATINSSGLFECWNSGGWPAQRLFLQRSTNKIYFYDGSNYLGPLTIAANTWLTFVACWNSAGGAIYISNGTSAEGAWTTGVVSLDSMGIGNNHNTAGTSTRGTIADYSLWVGDAAAWSAFHGAGAASNRTAVFAGKDPALVVGHAAQHRWRFDNSTTDTGSVGGVDFVNLGHTVKNYVVCMRDLSGGNRNFLATASEAATPTFSASAFSNAGGVLFTAASSQFLVCESAPVTAAPFQVYQLAYSSDATVSNRSFYLGNGATTNRYWSTQWAGSVGGDPVRLLGQDGTNTASFGTSTGYTANTPALVWDQESSTTSRAIEINGGSQGTDTTSLSPSGVNRVAIGGLINSTPSEYFGGGIGYVLILNTSSTSQKTQIQAWFTKYFGAP